MTDPFEDHLDFGEVESEDIDTGFLTPFDDRPTDQSTTRNSASFTGGDENTSPATG